MDRTKKIWSIVLLCALILLTVLLVVFVFFAKELVFEMVDLKTKAEALGMLFLLLALTYVLPLMAMFFGAIGSILSLVNIKISQSKVIKVISIGFCVLYSLLFLSSAVIGLYYWI